jgi:signal transduction histidine kinase
MDLPSDRELRIGIFRYEGANVYIKVSNNGPPISPENLEKIFIPFFTTKENGSGIGLYISRQIIHLHDGLLSVSSRPGETAFGIELKS